MATYRVISIGVLAAHPLWGEKGEVRPGHATTTLVESGARRILVDPSLPAPVLLARMAERAKIAADDVTDIFLTSFHPQGRRALSAFPQARWWLSEVEREACERLLAERLDEAHEADDEDLLAALAIETALLSKCEICPDQLAPKVDLFPLYGVTVGCAGLLITQPRSTVLICGDAIATMEHLEQGKVLPSAFDIQAAQDSFREAVEIADLLVLGRDNAVMNPLRLAY